MRNRFRKALNVLLVGVLLVGSINISTAIITEEDVVYETVESQVVSEGLVYEKRSKLTEDGWVDIHVLKMDLTEEYIDIDILRSATEWGGKDSLSDMAKGSEAAVVGGVNASFFNTSSNPTDIIGSEYNGDYASIDGGYNVYADGAGGLIQAGEDLFLDFFGASLHITYGEDRELYLYGINTVSDFTLPVIYNTVAIDNTAEIDELADLHKVVVDEGVVTYVAGIDESVDVPETGYVIAINDEIAEYHVPYMTVGTEINLEINNTLDREDIELVISGGGKILEDGELVETGLIVDPDNRHPRSAIGITEDDGYLIAMVVDGRGESIGATHEELGNYLLEYGVRDAIHMDGGGSSTLISRELGDEEVFVANDPSDGTERNIVNGLGFISTAPEGELEGLELRADTDRVFKNMPIEFEIIGYDEYYNPIEIDEEDIFWSVQGLTGSFDGMTFTPKTSGAGTITCYYDGKSTLISITSMDDYIDLDIYPETVNLREGQSRTFKITGTDSEGFSGEVSQDAITFTVEDSSLGSFDGNEFIAGDSVGTTRITAKAGDREVYAYVVVGSEYTDITSFEDITVSTLSYPVSIATGSAIATGSVPVYDGYVNIELSYELALSDETQAVYAVFEGISLEEEVSKLGLNVYGNNSGHLLKGRLVDSNGDAYNITFSSGIDWKGWEYIEADVPSGMAYPVTVERIYVAALSAEEADDFTIYFDMLVGATALNFDESIVIEEETIADPLLTSASYNESFSISLFGQTSGRNRLLDEVVLNEFYDETENNDVSIFAGNSDVLENKVDGDAIVWNNEYEIYDYDEVRVISLATDSGGLVDTDATQWLFIEDDLADTTQNTIIIVANASPIEDGEFDDDREAELLHDVLSEFQQKSGKAIFYVDGSGYDTGVTFYEGIRYIDVNGLWYNVSDDNELDLYSTFYTVDFYFDGYDVSYGINSLYAKVEID